MGRTLKIFLVVLAPICTILAIIYQLVSGKIEPTLVALVLAIPGMLIAGWKSLREFGLLRPTKLSWELNPDKVRAVTWQRGVMGTETIEKITDIIIPVRFHNLDVYKNIDILDVVVSSLDDEILSAPESQEISVGSENKWTYPMGDGVAYSELLNDGLVKTLKPEKVKEFVVGIRETGGFAVRSRIKIQFSDNFGRQYVSEGTVPIPEEHSQLINRTGWPGIK